ncbi:MAG: MBL fold metallo-hydrolase, partial [Planctomycetota bacterium]
MHFYSLQSGSHGNCLLVESNGTMVLFDAGISGAKVERRLRAVGVDVRSVAAVIVSHDHRDHVQCAGILARKFGLPVFMTETTYRAADARVNLGRIDRLRHFSSGETLQFGHLRVETIRTPHDAADGVAFVVDDGCRRLGILTDLGHPFPGLDGVLESLDAVLLESNYDP